MRKFSIPRGSESLQSFQNRIDGFTPKSRYQNNIDAIALVKSLARHDRELTENEVLTLGTFSGWGAIATVFDVRGHESGWKLEAQRELKTILSQEEYNLASESIVNAHYTDPTVIHAIWESLGTLGFDGGDILEPSCGTGLFFAGMPETIRSKSKLVGVELDKYPAKVAGLLHQDASIYNCGFQKTPFDDASFDLVVSNVPFGNYGVADTRYDHLKLSIHNYFLAKATDLVRPGGYIAIVTSTSFLDSKDSSFREWLGNRLHLQYCVRLPNNAFKGIADTEVCTDILFFRKFDREGTLDKNIPLWRDSDEIGVRHKEWGIVEEGNDDWAKFEADLNNVYHYEFNRRATDRSNSEIIKRLKSEEADQKRVEYWENKIYNKYKVELLLGNPCKNKLYGRGFALSDDGRDLFHGITYPATQRIKKYKSSVVIYKEVIIKEDSILLPSELIDTTKDGYFVIWNHELYQRRGNRIKKSQIDIVKVRDFIKLKESVDSLIRSQQLDKDIELESIQRDTLYRLEEFESSHGSILSKGNIKELGNDPRYYLVRSLRTSPDKLADILSKRICRTTETPSKLESPEDALMYSMNELGRFDIDFVSQIMCCDRDVAIDRLRGEGLIYFDPELDVWVRREEYMSGNVYQKLQIATEKQLESNINALKLVQPLPMLPHTNDERIKIACLQELGIDFDEFDDEKKSQLLSKSISVRLGTNWIPGGFYRDFANEVLKIHTTCKYIESPVATWVVDSYSNDRTEYGTWQFTSWELLEKGLNQIDPKVTIYDTTGEVDRVQSGEYTEAARGKLGAIKEAFLNWIWSDRDRAIWLTKYYNSHINVYAERKFDGSYLKFPGSNPNVNLRPWQRNSVARIIEQPSTFLAHEVGLGKTLEMVGGVMESRRLGLAKRPMLIALNGTEKQISDAFKLMYPMSNVYCPSKLDAEGRKLFTASVATGDFDCVIITLSQFFTLAMSSDYQVAFLNEEKQKMEDMLSDTDTRGLTKSIKKAIKKLENRISKITDSKRKDGHIDFEQLGIDMLVIDEIHSCKNLAVVTKIQNVRGIPTTHSQRATDTYMKLLYVAGDLVERGIVGKVVGSTGTIVSNTMAEIFTWQRMFQHSLLKEKGLDNFDAWLSQFGEQIASSEVSPSGEYRVITRFKSFQNLQVLRSMMGQFVDIVTVAMVGNDIIKRPSPKYIDVNVEPSEEQLEFLRIALKRSEAIRNRQVDPTEDNMLKVTSDLTKASLSMRLLGHQQEYHNSKLHECAFNVWKIWEATKDVKGVQAIFCDFSTPKNKEYLNYDYVRSLLIELGVRENDIDSKLSIVKNKGSLSYDYIRSLFIELGVSEDDIDAHLPTHKNEEYSIYEYIRLLLIELGVDENEIAFIHDHDKGKRAKFFDRINRGEIRVVLGSTGKLGTGCNIHLNGLWALHHVDAPWRPSDIEQREGRAIRQGNGENLNSLLTGVLVFRYITERLDALRWQTLQWKQEMINKFLNGNDLSSIEDCNQVVYSFAQVKSLATGNPLLIEESNLRNELNSLYAQHREHQRQQLSLGYKIETSRNRIAKLKIDIENIKKDIESSSPNKVWDTESLQVKAIEILKAMKLDGRDRTENLFYYKGFTLETRFVLMKKAFSMSAVGNHIYQFPFKVGDSKITVNTKELVSCIDKLIESLPCELERLQSLLVGTQTELDRFESLKGQSFPKQQRLNEIKNRLEVIDRELAATEEGLGVSAKDIDKDTSGEDEDEWFDLSQQHIDGWQNIDGDLVRELRDRATPTWIDVISQQISKM